VSVNGVTHCGGGGGKILGVSVLKGMVGPWGGEEGAARTKEKVNPGKKVFCRGKKKKEKKKECALARQGFKKEKKGLCFLGESAAGKEKKGTRIGGKGGEKIYYEEKVWRPGVPILGEGETASKQINGFRGKKGFRTLEKKGGKALLTGGRAAPLKK